jgi:ubiquinone/menaquinone biosynthesis C-methylase UbiE
MMTLLPEAPRILDVGCGPGPQTVELLRICSGSVVALDFLPQMIDRTIAAANAAGVADRLETVVQDMTKMTFPESSFDVVWSEGAIYNMGFQTGLGKFKSLVKPGGYVAVSEAVWLKPHPPAEAVEFWRDYPEIDTIAAKLEVIQRTGFELMGHFVFPESAWTDQYYDPMERRIAEKEAAWRGIPEAEAVLKEVRRELSVFRNYSDYFGYAFFIMRK